ncbi:MAG: SRPBCC family protein, partial [Acidobacteriota bacterium]
RGDCGAVIPVEMTSAKGKSQATKLRRACKADGAEPKRWIDRITPMKLACSIEIEAAPEQVFCWIESPERARQWVMNVSRSEYIRETPERVGTTFREYVEEGGQEIEMIGVVTEFQPNRLFAVHLESAAHTADVRFVLKVRSGKTLLTQDIELNFKNRLDETIYDTIKKAIMNQSRSEFAELKRLCEQDV